MDLLDVIAVISNWFLNWKNWFIFLLLLILVFLIGDKIIVDSTICNPVQIKNMCESFCFHQGNTVSSAIGVTFDCNECICVDVTVGILK